MATCQTRRPSAQFWGLPKRDSSVALRLLSGLLLLAALAQVSPARLTAARGFSNSKADSFAEVAPHSLDQWALHPSATTQWTGSTPTVVEPSRDCLPSLCGTLQAPRFQWRCCAAREGIDEFRDLVTLVDLNVRLQI